jgi:hypothetical protein
MMKNEDDKEEENNSKVATAQPLAAELQECGAKQPKNTKLR